MTLLLVCQAHNGVVLGSSPSGPTNERNIMRLIIIVTLASFSLYSCGGMEAWRESNIEKYQQMSPKKLCLSYLTAHTDNIWQDERNDVIEQRNIDCSPYIEEARLIIEKKKNEEESSNSNTNVRCVTVEGITNCYSY